MILIGGKVFGPTKEELTVVNSLGMGGFGQVFLVENIDKSISWALKTAYADGMTGAEYDALQNEGNLASSLENENIIRIHYFHNGSEYPSLPPYLLMDYAEGGSLKDLIDKRKASTVKFLIEELNSFFIQICTGMKVINEKLIHRDLHPGNVLLQKGKLKISDFGLSKLVDMSTRTRSFKGIQHVLYKAPESWVMQKNTIQMDMYSAGIIFYELAALKYPYAFPGIKDNVFEAHEAHMTQLPQPLPTSSTQLPSLMSEVIMKLLKKRPDDRFKNWDEVLELLSSGPKSTVVDVSSLVSKAQSTDRAEESKRIAMEKEMKELEEKDNILKYSIDTIISEINTLVSAFNAQTSTNRMHIVKDRDGRGFVVCTAKNNTIVCKCFFSELVSQSAEYGRIFGGDHTIQVPLKLNNNAIVFWGYFEVKSGRGLNIVLTHDNVNDLYGTWKVLIHHESSLAQRTRSVEPFPLDNWNELSRRILNMNAMDVIDTEQKAFSIDTVRFLFEEIL